MTAEARRSSVQPGDEIAGKYRVDRVLGQGGMGVVLAATHTFTHQRVAIKLLLWGADRSNEQEARFMNEARAAVQIQSEHCARVTDVDRLMSGEPYIVMEYLEGQDLAALLHARGQLPLEEAIDYVLQGSEALAEAHALGIVHRDLKPANLFLTHRRDRTPLVKVLDFGISRLGDAAGASTRLTRTRGAMGSPLYMSPEQLLTPKEVDAQADIWALGVVLFELLTGGWPFEAETMEGLVVEIATKPPRTLRSLRPDLPTAIEDVVARCLEKNRHERYASIAELAQALAPLAGEAARLSIDRIGRVLASAQREAPLAAAPTLDASSVGFAEATGRVSSGGTAVMSAPRATADIASAPLADLASGTRSLDPTARTFGGDPELPIAGAPKPRRWPLVAGTLAFLCVAAALVSTRWPSAPAATAVAPSAAASAAVAVPEGSIAPSVPSSAPTSVVLTPVAEPPPPATPATAARSAAKHGKPAPAVATVAPGPAATMVVVPPVAPPPPASPPPPKAGGPADFGGK